TRPRATGPDGGAPCAASAPGWAHHRAGRRRARAPRARTPGQRCVPAAQVLPARGAGRASADRTRASPGAASAAPRAAGARAESPPRSCSARPRSRRYAPRRGPAPRRRARLQAPRRPVEGRHVGLRAALGKHELVVLGDLLREAHAAVAEDAALAVDRDQRRELERLDEVALGLDEAGDPRAPAEGDVLQRALSALVAHR